MLTKSKKPWERRWSEVTPEGVYRSRREFLQTAAVGAAGIAVGGGILAGREIGLAPEQAALASRRNPKYVAEGAPNTFEELTNYNNFYEFGTSKDDPARNAHTLRIEAVDGEGRRPGRQARRLLGTTTSSSPSSSKSASTGFAASKPGRP